MDKKEYKSPHGWIIIFLIVFTLSIFLLTMIYTVDPADPKKPQNVKNPNMKKDMTTIIPVISTTTPPSTTPLRLVRDGKVLYRHDKMDVVQEALKHYLHSLPNVIEVSSDKNFFTHKVYSTKNLTLFLHGYELSKISVEKTFYIYDCSIVPTHDYLVVTILMELPPIMIELKDYPEYSMYCPSINPYIHVVELVYLWGYDKNTMETYNNMKLSNLKIFMVSWEDNLYRKSFEQVKNSPLYESNVPIPLDLKKEDIYDFLMSSNLLSEIPMIFNPTIKLQSFQTNNTTLF